MSKIDAVCKEIQDITNSYFITREVKKCPTKKHPIRYSLELYPYEPGVSDLLTQKKLLKLPHVLKVEYTHKDNRKGLGLLITFDCNPREEEIKMKRRN